MKSNIIGITGSKGYIGSRLIVGLENSIGIDRDNGGILSHELLDEFVAKCSVIIHTAGISGIENVASNELESYYLNVAGTCYLLDAMKRQNRPMKIIYISSSSVYGYQDRKVLSEYLTPNPLTIYGRQKLDVENILKMETLKGNLQATIIRLFNPWGLGGPDKSVTSEFVKAYENKDKAVEVWGQDLERDFIHIDDIVTALKLVANKDEWGYVFSRLNLGSGVGTKIVDIAGMLGLEANIIGSPRGNDEIAKIADISKIQNVFDFQPSIFLSKEKLLNHV